MDVARSEHQISTTDGYKHDETGDQPNSNAQDVAVENRVSPALANVAADNFQGALRQSSRPTDTGNQTHSHVPPPERPGGYSGSIRGGATASAPALSANGKLSATAAIVLSTIMALVTCVVVLSVALVLADAL